MPKNRRTKLLINPRLQLQSVVMYLGTAGVYILLQAVLLSRTMSAVADRLPSGGDLVMSEFLWILRTNLLITIFVLVPLTVSIGILITHRVVGPLYRFEEYLRKIVAGERPQPCKLRDGDELVDLCELLNQATVSLQADPDEPEAGSSAGEHDGLRRSA